MVFDPRAVSERRPVIICSQSVTQVGSYKHQVVTQSAGEPAMKMFSWSELTQQMQCVYTNHPEARVTFRHAVLRAYYKTTAA